MINITKLKVEDQELKVRKAVRKRYAGLAKETGACCEGSSCGCGEGSDVNLSGLPKEAVEINASCGSPLTLINPGPSDAVLDLGSGGGIDVFRASKFVGEKGKVIGVDSTPEMIWRARDTARKNGFSNVEFRLGEIEALPIGSDTVDYVISNCVINLSPDKQKVFNEAYRVLRKGGVFAVADITSESEIPGEIKENVDVWSSCVSGAIPRRQYEEQLKLAGFKDVEIRTIADPDVAKSICCEADGINAEQLQYGVKSTHIIARK